MTIHQQRRERLMHAVQEASADAMLVTNFVNVTYLTGFSGDDSYLLLTADQAVMLSDSRYDQQLREECPDVELEIRRTPTTMLEMIRRVVTAAGAGQLAVEADSVTLSLDEELRGALPQVQRAPTRGLVEKLREVKDEVELAAIRRSVQLAEQAMAQVRGRLRGEMTERQVAADLEHAIRQGGGTGCSFPPIVAVGPRAALPHARPTDHRLHEDRLLLVDWGAVREHYMSDLTRVLLSDKITPEIETVYGVVLTAQRRAIEAVRPGASMSAVDAAARGVIAEAGYGDNFGHGLGHGFGLEIHEQPRLAPNQDRPLEAGMVVTIEPGVYLPGAFGIRIEDDVLVTSDGHELLSSVPKQLEDCLITLP